MLTKEQKKQLNAVASAITLAVLENKIVTSSISIDKEDVDGTLQLINLCFSADTIAPSEVQLINKLQDRYPLVRVEYVASADKDSEGLYNGDASIRITLSIVDEEPSNN